MFGHKEEQKEEPKKEVKEKTAFDLPNMKPFALMTQQECVQLYNFYLNQIEKDCSVKTYDVSQFPTGTGQNIVNLLSPQTLQYYAFVGVFGESCGIIAQNRVLETYIFLKLALSRYSPVKVQH